MRWIQDPQSTLHRESCEMPCFIARLRFMRIFVIWHLYPGCTLGSIKMPTQCNNTRRPTTLYCFKESRMAHKANSTTTKCPLYLHEASGYWCKTVRGKRHYFGKDQAAAVERWHKQKDDLLAGRIPQSDDNAVTIAYACNYLLTLKKTAARFWRSIHPAIQRSEGDVCLRD